MHKSATKSFRLWTLILTSVFLLSTLVGCDHSENNILGKWQSGDATPIVWEFAKDHSVLMGSAKGRYTLGDRQRLKIETPVGTSIYQLELTDDRMALTDRAGSRVGFTRIK